MTLSVVRACSYPPVSSDGCPVKGFSVAQGGLGEDRSIDHLRQFGAVGGETLVTISLVSSPCAGSKNSNSVERSSNGKGSGNLGEEGRQPAYRYSDRCE